MYTNLLDIMRTFNIECCVPIIQDGKIHRFANRNKGNKSCWYILYQNGGAFGDWKQGISRRYYPDSYQQLPKYERELLNQKVRLAMRKAEEERRIAQEATAREAQAIMLRGKPSGLSPYLKRKQVSPYGIVFHSNYIAIPMKDMDGKLWNAQRIYSDGSKRFLRQGKKKGCFHYIGSDVPKHRIYMCEGYATAASVFEATLTPTVVCFDAGNIGSVVKDFRQRFPGLSITIAADNDAGKERNTGRETAEFVAKQYGCSVALPIIPFGKGGNDE